MQYQGTRVMYKSLKESEGLTKRNLFVETRQEKEELLRHVSINRHAEVVVG